MNIKLVFALFLTFTMTGCAKAPAEKSPIVGNDRDAHGCIGSAGYLWCAKTAQCERPWELAQQQGLAQKSDAFETFCNSQ
jgi:hypothetical protein